MKSLKFAFKARGSACFSSGNKHYLQDVFRVIKRAAFPPRDSGYSIKLEGAFEA